MSLRQAENKVKIEGILSEVNIQDRTFQKNGETKEAVSGVIKVKVKQAIRGEEVDLEIPVHMFATKLTNKGEPNPAYKSINEVKQLTSIAAAGGIAGASRIRITNGQLKMNEYYNQFEKLVSFPRIEASFINSINPEDCRDEASFTCEVVVGQKYNEVDAEGIETGKYIVKGILPQYGGKIDVFEFCCANENVSSNVSQYWPDGDTVKIKGRLNFTSETQIIVEDLGFGEADEKVRTTNVSELLITGGSQTGLEGEFAYNIDDVKAAMAERTARLDALKAKGPATKGAINPPPQSTAEALF